MDEPADARATPRGARTVRYVAGIPRKALPPGHVVVHNHVLPVGGRGKLGVDGFRAWIAAPGDDYEIAPCVCGWAPDLGGHYRVRSAGGEE